MTAKIVDDVGGRTDHDRQSSHVDDKGTLARPTDRRPASYTACRWLSATNSTPHSRSR